MSFLKRLLTVALILIVVLFGVLFSVKNNQPVVLDLWAFQLPPIWLSFLVIGAFALGALLGLAVSLFGLLKANTKYRLLERKLGKIEKQSSRGMTA